MAKAEVLNLEGIRASLERESGLWMPGDVGHISENSLVLEFRRDAGVAIPMASMKEVVRAGGGLASPFRVTARVVGRTEYESKSRYEFHMLTEDGTALVGMINRRMAQRIKPNPDQPIRVQLQFDKSGVGEELVLVHARDISITGIGVFADEKIESDLYDVDDLRLRIHVPTEGDFFGVEAIVRNRSLVGRDIVYGLMFDDRATEDFATKQQKIAGYIRARELQIRATRKLKRS